MRCAGIPVGVFGRWRNDEITKRHAGHRAGNTSERRIHAHERCAGDIARARRSKEKISPNLPSRFCPFVAVPKVEL